MNIVLGILISILILLILILITNLKIYVEYDNLGSSTDIIVKAYIIDYIRVFKKRFVQEKEEKSFFEKAKNIIDYLIKNRADPVEYAEKKIKKSPKVSDRLKKLSFRDIKIRRLELKVFLGMSNAAVTAIVTGGLNSILGMIRAKYEENIVGPVDYRVIPVYEKEGIRIKLKTIATIKVYKLLKILFVVKT